MAIVKNGFTLSNLRLQVFIQTLSKGLVLPNKLKDQRDTVDYRLVFMTHRIHNALYKKKAPSMRECPPAFETYQFMRANIYQYGKEH